MIDVDALALSLRVALLASALAGALGVAIAGRAVLRGGAVGELLEAVATAPLVLPPTVLGYVLLVALGRRSAIGGAWERVFGEPLAFSVTGAVVAASVSALPLVAKTARAALESVDPRYAAAARTLGRGELSAFVSVTLPLARRGVVAGVLLGFARALGDFGVTLMLAGDLPGVTRTAALSVYAAVQAGRDADARATAVAVTVLALTLLGAARWLERRRP